MQPEYGNWVPTKLISGPGAIGLVCLVASAWFLPLAILAAVCLLIALYFAYARYMFAARGGNLQAQIADVLLARLRWDGSGQAIDIGCGNGALAIRLARRYPEARITGVDFWGPGWEYSRRMCEANARIIGADDRLTFQKASAAALPFAEGTFDAAVSNLVFHEVRDAKEKRDVIREALRVVKKGGAFAFQDLFMERRLYGDPDDLVRTITSWGITRVELVDTSKAAGIPMPLKLPFMVGRMAVIVGEK